MPTIHHVREISLAGSGLVIASAMKFMRVPFCEIALTKDDHLIEAWSSNRFFAWSERTFFRTPYTHADVWVTPHSFGVSDVLRAEMIGDREAAFEGEEDHTIEVQLAGGRYFIAKLQGFTTRYPVIESDRIDIPNFEAREWIIRSDAIHGKSRTYLR